MADNLDPREIERYRRQALEFARRSQVRPETSYQMQPEFSPDMLPQGDTVQPEVNPPSTATSYEQFLREHPGEGTLKVQITAARGTFPVEGATVEVSLMLDGERYVLHRNATDESGITDGMRLPAFPSSASQSEATASGSGTQYNVSIFHPAFAAKNDESVTIFDAIQTILPVTLQPIISPERRDI